MQDFNKVNLTDLVRDAIVKLDDTTQSLATSFSGDAFPTNNVEKGMTCYRTDKKILYICTGVDENGLNTWEEIGHIGIKPGTDDNGNTISSTYTTQTAAKEMQDNIDTVDEALQTTAKTMTERFNAVNADIQTNKANLENHTKDSNAHASVLSNYVKTADVTPSLLYDALHKYGNNYVPSDVTNKGWTSLGTFISYYTQKVLNNQPTQYGQLINLCADKSNEATQIWLDQCSGKLAFRGGNGSKAMNDMAFTYVATEDKAGVVDGNVSNANSWWVKLSGVIPLIVQGGNGTAGSRKNINITFPVKMSKVLYVGTTGVLYSYENTSAYNNAASIGVKSYTTSGMIVQTNSETYDNYWKNFSWIVVGV